MVIPDYLSSLQPGRILGMARRFDALPAPSLKAFVDHISDGSGLWHPGGRSRCCGLIGGKKTVADLGRRAEFGFIGTLPIIGGPSIVRKRTDDPPDLA